MNEKYELICERKNEINKLCGEIRWVYRGYYTTIREFVSYDSFDDDFNELISKLLSLDDSLSSEAREIYESFLKSCILFLKNYCRPSEFLFRSIIKISDIVEDSFLDKHPFDKSTYGYMCENYLKANDKDKYEQWFNDETLRFADLYNNAKEDYTSFSIPIIKMIDILLYENEKSFILDKNYEEGIKQLSQFLGYSRSALRSSLRRVDENE